MIGNHASTLTAQLYDRRNDEGWSLQDSAWVVRAGHGRSITWTPLGMNARQKPGFLSGIEVFGTGRAYSCSLLALLWQAGLKTSIYQRLS